MLKKIILFVSLLFMSNFVFTLSVQAAEVICNYGGYVVKLSNGAISVTFENPASYYSQTSAALRASDIETSTGVYSCPANLYVKTTIDGSGRSGSKSFSFVAETYSDASAVALTSGTLDGKDINTVSSGGTPAASEGEGNNTEKDNDGEQLTCEDFKTKAGVDLLNGVFGIFMIAGPILLIILGSVDFAKATLAGDEQALRKAGVNFGKRAIATILLFLIPLILNVIFKVAFNAGVFGTLGETPASCIEKQ